MEPEALTRHAYPGVSQRCGNELGERGQKVPPPKKQCPQVEAQKALLPVTDPPVFSHVCPG